MRSLKESHLSNQVGFLYIHLALTNIDYLNQTLFLPPPGLNITPSELFDLDAENPAKLRGIIDNLKRLDDRQLDTIANLINEIVK
ncbi:MAG: hypothetical protein IKT52_01080 [Oscillospiraceae bacterium]|nr:hypothetical protein [Oscillospiraceae bacterium]